MNYNFLNLAFSSKFRIIAPWKEGSHRSVDLLEWHGFITHPRTGSDPEPEGVLFSDLLLIRHILGNVPHTTQEPK